MSIDKSKQAFEAWYLDDMEQLLNLRERAKQNLEWRLPNGDYADPALRLAFMAWQASSALSAEALAGTLTTQLSLVRGRPVEWHEAIEITAIVTRMDSAEKQRLLDLDEV